LELGIFYLPVDPRTSQLNCHDSQTRAFPSYRESTDPTENPPTVLSGRSDQLAAIPEEAVWLANFVSPRTRRTYQAAVQSFVVFHGLRSSDELREVGQSHLIAWREHLLQSGASPRTVQNRLAAVSSLFKHLCEKQVATRNPVTGVRRPRVNSQRVDAAALAPEQVRRLLHTPPEMTLKGIRDRAILHVLFYAGCRVSEVTHLKVRDFFEDAGYWVLDFLIKGGQRNRLAIHHELQLALRTYLAQSGHGAERESPLFLAVQRSERRKSLTSRQISKLFHRYAREAGLLRPRSGLTSRRHPAQRAGDFHHRGARPKVPDRSGTGQRRPSPHRHHQNVRQAQVALPGERQFRRAVLR